MNNLQFEILNALHKSNGMAYIDVINLFPSQYTETRLMLHNLKKKGFVSFSNHDETNSFVKITPSGFYWLSESIDKIPNDIKCSNKRKTPDAKTDKLYSIFNFLKQFCKFIISASALITAIGVFIKAFEFFF